MKPSQQLQQKVSESGARVRIGFPPWLRPFVVRNVEAITLGRRIYIREGVADGDLDRLLLHELAHVRQMIDNGFIRFCWRYVGEYIRNRRSGMPPHDAYRHISFEREAETAERRQVDI